MVVVGAIIGAGIFINPCIVAQRLGSPGWVLAAWLAGGVIALAGALTFAELGTLFPRAGGHYVYLREAYHPLAGFLYGWGLLLMIECGAIAAVAITFAEYALRLGGGSSGLGKILAIMAIVLVAAVNYVGVKPGSRLLNVFVILKLVPLGLLIGVGLLFSGAQPAAATRVAADTAGAGSPPLLLAFGAALIPVMFTYGGWQNANYVTEEMKDPVRDLPTSLLAGTGIVVLVYAAVNWVYLHTLGHAGLAATETPASDTARILFGPTGNFLITLGIAVSTFGFLNLTMLAPTRVYYAMARDGLFPERVARLHPRFDTPSVAIVVQALWAIALVATGTYGELLDYVISADWIFFGMAGASLFVFRRRLPVSQRAAGVFRAPGYPLVPGLFVAVSVLIVSSVFWNSPRLSLIGLGVLAAGVPAYLFWNRKQRSHV